MIAIPMAPTRISASKGQINPAMTAIKKDGIHPRPTPSRNPHDAIAQIQQAKKTITPVIKPTIG